jgi:hypothetical protein
MLAMHLTQIRLAGYESVMNVSSPANDPRREATGFLVAAAFVLLAAVRDVYLGGLFQRITPLLIAIVAFSLCTVLVNITTACAWVGFLYALKLIEPTIVQILYSGIGPLSVIWIERNFSTAGGVPLSRPERIAFLGLFAALMFSAVVVLAGLSGAPSASIGDAALGVIFAAGGGIAISVATMLCRRLNDAGVTPSALLALRFPATAASAFAVLALSPSGLPTGSAWLDAVLVIAALLIVLASFVNQVAISLASPLTVRVVLAVGPVLIFFLQMVEGRLAASLYSLTAATLYAFAALAAAIARQRAIRICRPPKP